MSRRFVGDRFAAHKDATAIPSAPKAYKGVFYFRSHAAAKDYAAARGWPTDRILEYGRGWAIQGGVSGDYAGPHGLRVGDWGR